MSRKNQILFMVKVSHNNVGVVIHISVLKVTSTVVFVGLRTFTLGGGMHGLFKSICRSGANPEKTLRIRRGAMQVYHHNQ